MTEDQLKKWQARRAAAKKIKDPVAREKALDIVYDMKDDMQLDCQRKMADRIKYLVKHDVDQRADIDEIKASVSAVTTDLDDHLKDYEADHEVVNTVRESRLKASGALTVLKWLGYVAAAGGGAAIKWFLEVVNKAGGVQ